DCMMVHWVIVTVRCFVIMPACRCIWTESLSRWNLERTLLELLFYTDLTPRRPLLSDLRELIFRLGVSQFPSLRAMAMHASRNSSARTRSAKDRAATIPPTHRAA